MKSICIIGLGLIGGSIARDVKLKKIAKVIYALDTNSSSLEKAKERGWIDIVLNEFNEITNIKPDLIIVATPPKSSAKILLDLVKNNSLVSSTIIDTASTKGFIHNKLQKMKVENIVLSHPMAGSHKSGIDAAKEDLFDNKKTIIINAFDVSEARIAKAKILWQKLGSQTIIMGVDEHDHAVAYASHLPHLLAFALTDAIRSQSNPSINQSSAGGLKEFLRIAASDEEMWSDIFITNKEAIFKSYKEFNLSIEKIFKNINDEKSLKLTLKEIKNFKSDNF